MVNKSRFSYFFIIVMVVIALGLMFLGDDDSKPENDAAPAVARPDGGR